MTSAIFSLVGGKNGEQIHLPHGHNQPCLGLLHVMLCDGAGVPSSGRNEENPITPLPKDTYTVTFPAKTSAFSNKDSVKNYSLILRVDRIL